MTFKVTTTKLNFGDAYRYLFSGWISWENSTGANACLFWLISHSLALILDERLATFFLRWSNIVFITTRIKEGFGVLDEQNAIMQSLLSRWCGCEVPNEVAESRILPFMSCRELDRNNALLWARYYLGRSCWRDVADWIWNNGNSAIYQ